MPSTPAARESAGCLRIDARPGPAGELTSRGQARADPRQPQPRWPQVRHEGAAV